MNEFQIANALTRSMDGNFGGVFSSNEVPQFKRGCGYVINTDCYCWKGTHWIAVYYPSSGCVEFFDSYGLSPANYEIVKPGRACGKKGSCVEWEFLKRKWKFSEKRLQGFLSSTCGHYCIMFLLFRHRGHSMGEFLDQFGDDLDVNDEKVVDMFTRVYNDELS